MLSTLELNFETFMSIFVIDDHPLMREAVVMLIRRINSNAKIVELDRVAAIAPAVETHGVPELICLDLYDLYVCPGVGMCSR